MIHRTAEISQDEVYRYRLGRHWHGFAHAGGSTCLFIMLNPSTADANIDDHTIRRCMYYAARWGHSELLVGNLFAFRATYPKDLKAAADPVGPGNDWHLEQLIGQANQIICAWGTDGAFMNRDQEVLALIDGHGQALTVTKHGFPGHPARLANDLVPVPYTK